MLSRLIDKCYCNSTFKDEHLNWLEGERVELLCSYLDMLNVMYGVKAEVNVITKSKSTSIENKDNEDIVYFFGVSECCCFDFSISKDKVYLYRVIKGGGIHSLEVKSYLLADALSYMIDDFNHYDRKECESHSKEKERILNVEKS